MLRGNTGGPKTAGRKWQSGRLYPRGAFSLVVECTRQTLTLRGTMDTLDAESGPGPRRLSWELSLRLPSPPGPRRRRGPGTSPPPPSPEPKFLFGRRLVTASGPVYSRAAAGRSKDIRIECYSLQTELEAVCGHFRGRTGRGQLCTAKVY